MQPQFARNPADTLQCYSHLIEASRLNRDDPSVALLLHEMPIYFISSMMGRTLAEISASFPIDRFDASLFDRGFLVFERPTLFVQESGRSLAVSGLMWEEQTGVIPFFWNPPHFYRFNDDHRQIGAKWIGALAALLRQKLASLKPRPVSKRLIQRLKLPSEPRCQIVVLRERRERTPAGTRAVEWSCRWLVRGHWRVIESGPTWVTAHIKGPESKPLKPVADRIFAVVR